MAVTQIINKVTLGQWLSTDIGTDNYCYLIAKKEAKGANDTIDPAKVVRIALAIGIDSGVTNHPIIVQRVNLSFNDAQYMDAEIDKKIVFTKLANIPSNFYIKVLSVDDGQKEITSGSVAISVSTNAMKLL